MVVLLSAQFGVLLRANENSNEEDLTLFQDPQYSLPKYWIVKQKSGKQDVTRIISNLQSAAFNAEAFRSSEKNAADFDDLAKQDAKTEIVNRGFRRRLLGMIECLEETCSGCCSSRIV